MKNAHTIIALSIFIFFFFGQATVFSEQDSSEKSASPTTLPSPIIYQSDHGDTLLVQYDTIENTVALAWDGTTIILTETVSASGVKYSNPPFVFWNKADSATFIKNETILFRGIRVP